jgi:uncharacterized protein YggE
MEVAFSKSPMCKKSLLLLLTASMLHCLAAAEPELKGTAAELTQLLANLPKTVTINAEAEVRAPADQAVVTLKVVTDSKSLQEALRANQEVRAKLFAYYKNHNVPPERIHASRFSSTPKFGLFGDKAKSYRVENLVRITVEDEREFQMGATIVDTFPEVQYVGADFEHRDKDALKLKALAQACDNAERKRKLMEEKLGVKLKPERFFNNAAAPIQNTEFARHYVGSAYSSGAKSGSSTAGSSGVTDLPGLEDVSSFGELVYKAEVTLEYSVQSK